MVLQLKIKKETVTCRTGNAGRAWIARSDLDAVTILETVKQNELKRTGGTA